uniref:DDE Tnp4 domain-containing protein n=1 Tax=Neogobius melanostomus TaxID=47308 RepID=A0A8C6SHY5_9GOBI
MSAEKMEELLSIIGPDLRRQCTTYRAAIEPKQRLAVGLRYLASGDSFVSLAFSYRLGETTVRNSVYMVSKAIERIMMAQYLPPPTEDTWREVAQRFWEKWNFPNCLGALDGKHVVIEKPPRSGSLYFNYKKTFSTVLMALVDADYRFLVINVGDYGRSSDGGIYAGSALGIGMEHGTLHVPPNAPLPGEATGKRMPHVIVADAAFPLKNYLMRPYPGALLDREKRIYNY